ncbi:MAG: hypothetical protein D6798_10195, partial [Deltaproteobacteria bacterium]
MMVVVLWALACSVGSDDAAGDLAGSSPTDDGSGGALPPGSDAGTTDPDPSDTGDDGLPDTDDPYQFCEELGAGLVHLRMPSVHGRAYFWDVQPASVDNSVDPGFLLAMQASTVGASVCDDPISWDWVEQPEIGATYLVLDWAKKPGDPNDYPGIYHWDGTGQESLGGAELIRLFLLQGVLDDGVATPVWWYPVDYGDFTDQVWMCVTDVTPQHISYRLVVFIDAEASRYTTIQYNRWPAGYLIDVDAEVGPTDDDPVPDDDPCFDIKTT